MPGPGGSQGKGQAPPPAGRVGGAGGEAIASAASAGHRPRHRGGKQKPAVLRSSMASNASFRSENSTSAPSSLPGTATSLQAHQPRSTDDSDALRSSLATVGGSRGSDARPEELSGGFPGPHREEPYFPPPSREEFVVPIQPRVQDPRRRYVSKASAPRPAEPASSSGGSTRASSYMLLSCPEAVRGVLPGHMLCCSPRGSSVAGSSAHIPGAQHEAGGGGAGGSSTTASTGAQGSTGEVPWDNLVFGHQIQPYLRHAHRLLDVSALSCFLDIARVSEISGESVKLLLRTLKFLRACDYHNEDICCILAHSSAYFIDAFSLCGQSMSSSEVGNVLAILIFVAHAWVQDETCPLRIWHQHLFKQYCELDVLNKAIVRLLEIRSYILRVEREEIKWRFARLKEASYSFPTHPPTAGRFSGGGFMQPLSDLRDQLARCVDRSST